MQLHIENIKLSVTKNGIYDSLREVLYCMLKFGNKGNKQKYALPFFLKKKQRKKNVCSMIFYKSKQSRQPGKTY